MVNHLTSQLPSQPSSFTPSIPISQPVDPITKTRGLKVAPPDTFDGSPGKAEAFLSQLLLYFHGKRHEIQDDHDKIIMALSYMKGGTAGPWAKLKVKQYASSDTITQDWKDFHQEFLETFGDPDPAGSARHKMELLRQGNQTADEYVAKFRELQDDTGYNDAALVEKFEKGLNSVLVDKIYTLPEMPSTLKEWMSWATKLDRQWRQREAKKKSIQNSTSRPFTLSPQSQSPPPSKPFAPVPTSFIRPSPVAKDSGPVPMEIDSGWKTVKPIVCWKCRKTGHIASNCRSSVNINNMDFDSLKAYIQEEIKKEKEQPSKKEDF